MFDILLSVLKAFSDRIFGLCRVDGTNQTEEIHPSDGDSVEYFFASDASAIIEHTNRVIFLEDDDVAACKNGVLSIHRYVGPSDHKPY